MDLLHAEQQGSQKNSNLFPSHFSPGPAIRSKVPPGPHWYLKPQEKNQPWPEKTRKRNTYSPTQGREAGVFTVFLSRQSILKGKLEKKLDILAREMKNIDGARGSEEHVGIPESRRRSCLCGCQVLAHPGIVPTHNRLKHTAQARTTM